MEVVADLMAEGELAARCAEAEADRAEAGAGVLGDFAGVVLPLRA